MQHKRPFIRSEQAEADRARQLELLDDDGRFLADHPCLNCGYNLRGCAVPGDCPECGGRIRVRPRPPLNPVWRRSAQRALRLAAGIYVLVVLAHLALLGAPLLGPAYAAIVLLLAAIGVAALMLITSEMLDRHDPGCHDHRVELTRRIARAVGWIAPPVLLAFTLYAVWWSLLDQTRNDDVEAAAYLGSLLTLSTFGVAHFYFLSRIATTARWLHTRTACRFAIAANLVLLVTCCFGILPAAMISISALDNVRRRLNIVDIYERRHLHDDP